MNHSLNVYWAIVKCCGPYGRLIRFYKDIPQVNKHEIFFLYINQDFYTPN